MLIFQCPFFVFFKINPIFEEKLMIDRQITIPQTLATNIEVYCNENGLEYNKFIEHCIRVGFASEVYGNVPNVKTAKNPDKEQPIGTWYDDKPKEVIQQGETKNIKKTRLNG